MKRKITLTTRPDYALPKDMEKILHFPLGEAHATAETSITTVVDCERSSTNGKN